MSQLGHAVDSFGPDTYEPWQFMRGRANNYRIALGMLGFTLQQIRQKDYDIIEFYGGDSWLTVLILNYFWKNKYLLVSHSNGLETQFNEVMNKYAKLLNTHQKWYQIDQSFLFENAFKFAHGIVTQSNYDRDYALQHQYGDKEHILTISSGLLEDYLGLSVDFNRPPILGYCGSWIARKGIQLIQQDIPKILKEFPQCQFKIIGVGKDFHKEDYFHIEICDRIEVIPFIESKKELAKVYQSISIMLVPSIYESFGLAIAEAMACGCAVVASRVGFAADLTSGKEIIVLNQIAYSDLYKSVKMLLEDEKLRYKIAQNGYQKVQNLTWKKAIQEIEIAYNRWLKEIELS
ncbi:glycosyltransferase family 4 protein [Spirulina sp. 06S082]|uniref:glycosyltransferase family 4 protein n=1 Tax=Spirulina sp. 06S082 TaxID=3110248 RepID=UPI002B207E51|nr:glycosyltransferase family 4 protein [Spirulina sp. 06S082]MEA5467365.1 glycosyltransferase family 4 protein [Spirulina sp. 06S082]